MGIYLPFQDTFITHNSSHELSASDNSASRAEVILSLALDIHEAIVQLSSVLGHEDIKYTYWYIEQVPELIASAFRRVSS